MSSIVLQCIPKDDRSTARDPETVSLDSGYSSQPHILGDKQSEIVSSDKLETDDDGETLPFNRNATKSKWSDHIVVVGAFCSLLSTLGIINSVGLLQGHLERNQLKEWSHSEVGWIAAANIWLTLCSPLLAGPIYDRWGHSWIMGVGCTLFSSGIILMSIFDGETTKPKETYWLLFASWGILCGFGAGLVSTAAAGVTSRCFNERRGLAFGLSSAGSPVGGIVWPLILRTTLRRWGWYRAMVLLGGAATFILALGYLCLRGKGVRPRRMKSAALVRAVYQADFVFMTLSLLIFQFVVMGIVGTLPIWGIKKSFDKEMLFYIVATANGGSVVGRSVGGFASDRIGRFNSVILSELMGAVFIFLFLTVRHTTWRFFALVPCWGFTSGAVLNAMTVLIREVCDEAEFGAYFGINSFVISIGGLASVPASAAILTSLGPDVLMTILGCAALASAFLLCLSRAAKTGWKWTVLVKV